MERGVGSPLANTRRVTVPKDSLYVVGDNRDYSEDSRRWGYVKAADVLGVVSVPGGEPSCLAKE